MNDLTTKLSSLSDAHRKASQKMHTAREEMRAVRRETQKVKRVFIDQELEKFLEDMKNPILRNQYIRGNYTSPFTKFVKRAGWNMEHNKAIEAYMAAFRNLNRVFVEQLEVDDYMQDAIVNDSTLKNLGKLAR